MLGSHRKIRSFKFSVLFWSKPPPARDNDSIKNELPGACLRGSEKVARISAVGLGTVCVLTSVRTE